MSERAIAEAGGGFGGLVLLVGHLAVRTSAVSFFVVVARKGAGVLGIGVGGHGGWGEVRARKKRSGRRGSYMYAGMILVRKVQLSDLQEVSSTG